MKKEIDVALDILVSYVQRFGSIKQECIEQFRTKLQENLHKHYQDHWYPEKPIKGQAYRSLEFNKENDYCDHIVFEVCHILGFTPSLLGIRHDLTLWIDPYEVTIRLGNHASPKENQQLLVARFDKEGNQLVHNDLDALLSQSRIPINVTNTLRSSPTNISSCDSASCSGSSTPQRTSSPHPSGQHSLVLPSSVAMTTATTINNNNSNCQLVTLQRALPPQAPTFNISPSAPIQVPIKSNHNNSFNNNTESTSYEGSPIDGNNIQPDRSDTPHSIQSTTSNESSDSGYCGYVESFPYYYKLNRLQKALAIQKLTMNPNHMGKGSHNSSVHQNHYHQQQQSSRRIPSHHHHHHHHHHQQQQQLQQQLQHHHQQQQQMNNNNNPSLLSSSPPTPTPKNINQFAAFYAQQSSYLPMPTTVADNRTFKY